MKGRLPALLLALVAFVLAAFVYPLGELWYKCLEPVSEACVWGKALLPVSLAIWGVMGLGAALLTYVIARMVQRRRAPRT
jgi:hypothetical protein